MPEPIPLRSWSTEDTSDQDGQAVEAAAHAIAPSNSVHARVGDSVLDAAREGVRRGLRPEDIIREVRASYHVHLSLGELRLLLASRDRRKTVG